ncbi:TPA: molybdenum cofactor biosynthesis protein MoaE [Candidatus Bathyarchaeota archaeon]|nr:molybdenum cofactor biosynthesis protein MoaE [Candidatus Bathyarchaeota archaeon]
MIRVTRDDFSVDEELKRITKPSVGGLVTFVGTVRDSSEAGRVTRMEIEVYPEMAEKQLEAIRGAALNRFGVEDVLVVHRFGDLRVGDNIVLVAVSAGHREAAFDACRYVIDELKKRVPIWKREHTSSGARWVEDGRPDQD